MASFGRPMGSLFPEQVKAAVVFDAVGPNQYPLVVAVRGIVSVHVAPIPHQLRFGILQRFVAPHLNAVPVEDEKP